MDDRPRPEHPLLDDDTRRTQQLMNPSGVMHGGASFGLADSAVASARYSSGSITCSRKAARACSRSYQARRFGSGARSTPSAW